MITGIVWQDCAALGVSYCLGPVGQRQRLLTRPCQPGFNPARSPDPIQSQDVFKHERNLSISSIDSLGHRRRAFNILRVTKPAKYALEMESSIARTSQLKL